MVLMGVKAVIMEKPIENRRKGKIAYHPADKTHPMGLQEATGDFGV